MCEQCHSHLLYYRYPSTRTHSTADVTNAHYRNTIAIPALYSACVYAVRALKSEYRFASFLQFIDLVHITDNNNFVASQLKQLLCFITIVASRM